MDIDAVIAEHGWAVQAVLDDGPGAPAFAYTIGLFDRLPELLCVGPPPEIAAPTLNALARLLLRRPQLARAGRCIELSTGGGVLSTIQLGEVASRWQELYVGGALAHHRRDDIALLQVLAPDDDGRFPDDPRVAACSLDLQPVLADAEHPWRLPHGIRTLAYLVDHGVRLRHAVLLPIVAAGLVTGREELVAAGRVGADWQLLAQPSLADWCTEGDVVAASPVDEPIPRVGDLVPDVGDLEVVRFDRVVRPSPRVVLRWGASFHDDDGIDILEEILARPHFAEVSVGLGAAPHALTFAVPVGQAEPLRIALRPLERDGYLVPRALFHQHEDLDLADPHPDCRDCQTRR